LEISSVIRAGARSFSFNPSLEMDSDVPTHNLVEMTDVEIRAAEPTPPHCVDEDPGFIPVFGFFSVRPSSR